jgi:alpha-L-fucosidase
MGQKPPNAPIDEDIQNNPHIREAVAKIKPSKAQLAYQEDELIAFIHYGINNYTGRQWGRGNEDPKLFAPTSLDTDQWAKAMKEAGFKGFIFTSKHHDGLCLWPTRYSEHNITNTSYQKDLLKSLRVSADQYGLKFGLYYSLSDGNAVTYGTKSYTTYVQNQLKELIQNYSPIEYFWFDGATPSWIGEKHKPGFNFDITTWKSLVRELSPNSLISGEGYYSLGHEKLFLPDSIFHTEKQGKDYKWSALDSHTSVRDFWGNLAYSTLWFANANTRIFIRNKYNMRDAYYQTVGKGLTFLLNLSPEKSGLLDQKEIQAIKELGNYIQKTFKTNLAKEARVNATHSKEEFGPENILDNNVRSFWTTEDFQEQAALTIDLGSIKEFDVIMIREAIKEGQRIESFEIDIKEQGQWKTVVMAETMGNKRLFRFDQLLKTDTIRVRINASRFAPTISEFGIYKEAWK